MSKLILTDVDDTILQFADPFQEWVHARGVPTEGRFRDLYCVMTVVGIGHEDATKLINEYSTQPGIMDNLPPENDAAEVLPELYADGWRFVAITACVNTPEVIEARRRNLEKTFGFPFEELHCLGLHAEKKDTLAQYPDAIWVEDNVSHAITGAQLGHRSFLLDRGYNRHMDHHSVERVPCWRTIRERIENRS